MNWKVFPFLPSLNIFEIYYPSGNWRSLFFSVNSRIYVKASTERPTLAARENRHFYTSSTFSNKLFTRQVVDSTTNWSRTKNYHLQLWLTMSAKVSHSSKNKQEKLEKPRENKTKTNPWGGKDLGGWGVSFCLLFFCFLEAFATFDGKLENLERTKKPNPWGWVVSFCFL